MLYFPQIKNTTPQLGDFGATETAFALPLFCTLGDSLREQTSKPEETERGSCNCAELLKTMGDLLVCLFVCFFLFSISDHIPPPTWVMD